MAVQTIQRIQQVANFEDSQQFEIVQNVDKLVQEYRPKSPELFDTLDEIAILRHDWHCQQVKIDEQAKIGCKELTLFV